MSQTCTERLRVDREDVTNVYRTFASRESGWAESMSQTCTERLRVETVDRQRACHKRVPYVCEWRQWTVREHVTNVYRTFVSLDSGQSESMSQNKVSDDSSTDETLLNSIDKLSDACFMRSVSQSVYCCVCLLCWASCYMAIMAICVVGETVLSDLCFSSM